MVYLDNIGRLYIRTAFGTFDDQENTLIGMKDGGICVFFLSFAEFDRRFAIESDIDPTAAARALLSLGARLKMTAEAREQLEWLSANSPA